MFTVFVFHFSSVLACSGLEGGCQHLPAAMQGERRLPTNMMVHSRYTYTAEDVQRMLDEKRAGGFMRNSAAEKARLERLREAAVDKDDLEEANR